MIELAFMPSQPLERHRPPHEPHNRARLSARPATSLLQNAITPGRHPLNIGARGRDALLFVPANFEQTRPVPLALVLHGAGAGADQGIGLLQNLADAAGVLLLAPDSRGRSWDVILGDYGPDVAFINRALEQVFARFAVDPAHLAIGGFSDGASYALCLGLTNGDLFSHVLAFAPGFMAPTAQHGAPRVYISHGTHDSVLPIERCSRRLVPQLERAGYDVFFREFDGPHSVPPEIAREALAWFLA